MRLWTVLVFCVFARLGSVRGGLSSFLPSIVTGLYRTLFGSGEEPTADVPDINVTYVAPAGYNLGVMEYFYNCTPFFINLIAKKHAYPEGLVIIREPHEFPDIAPLSQVWTKVLGHYIGPIFLMTIVVLLVVGMPILAIFFIFFCFTRKRETFTGTDNSKNLAIAVSVLTGLLLIGMAIAFVIDTQLEDNANHVAKNIKNGITNVQTFLNTTFAYAQYLFVDNFDNIQSSISEKVTNGEMNDPSQRRDSMRESTVKQLRQLASALRAAPGDLRQLRDRTHELRTRAAELNLGLRQVRKMLLRALANCKEPECVKLQEEYNVNRLSAGIDYDKIPDVTQLAANVSALLEGGGAAVARGLSAAAAAAGRAAASSVANMIAALGSRIREEIAKISAKVRSAMQRLQRLRDKVDEYAALHTKYAPYRRHATCAVFSVLLAALLCLLWGLLCGVYGKARYCFNQLAGAQCLICVSALALVAGSAMGALALAHLAAGLAAQRLVCDPLYEPRNNRVFRDLEKIVQLEQTMYGVQQDPDFNLTSVLVNCHNNETIYETLQLERIVNLLRIQEEFSRNQTFDPGHEEEKEEKEKEEKGEKGEKEEKEKEEEKEEEEEEEEEEESDVEERARLLGPAARQRLMQLADSGLSNFNFDDVLEALEENITLLELEKLAEQVHSSAQMLPPRGELSEVAWALAAAGARLRRLRAPALRLRHALRHLNETARKIRGSLRLDETPLKETISSWIQDVIKAEKYLKKGRRFIGADLKGKVRETVAMTLQRLLSYLSVTVQQRLGACAPLSAAFNASRDSACRAVVPPANGFWMLLFWCLMLLIALLVAAYKLGNLYLYIAPRYAPDEKAKIPPCTCPPKAVPIHEPSAKKRKVRFKLGKSEKRLDTGARERGRGEAGGGDRTRRPALAPTEHWQEGIHYLPARIRHPTEIEQLPSYGIQPQRRSFGCRWRGGCCFYRRYSWQR